MVDGRVGRVQRMVSASLVASSTVQDALSPDNGLHDTFGALNIESRGGRSDRGGRGRGRSGIVEDARNDTYEYAPPEQSLDDFLTPRARRVFSEGAETHFDDIADADLATCPICNDFKGDEAAVTHHVDTHFT
jgi:hypothetical protein